MIRKLVFASAAAVIGLSSPAFAQDTGGGDPNTTSDVEIDFRNNLDTSIVTDVRFAKDVLLTGTVTINGNIEVDSAAVAVSDTKQITNDNAVIFDEGQATDQAFVRNTAGQVDVNATGNVGVNTAAGYYNSQANVGTIAVATNGNDGDGDGNVGGNGNAGMAEASTTALQSLTNTYYGPQADSEGNDPYVSRNLGVVGNVAGSGNIGVNSAAGAFNQQQNIMTLAVATDSALAEANAGVVQFTNANTAILHDSENFADVGVVTGAGNMGINAAAGVGNQQVNSLTVAASGAFGGNGTGGAGNGGL